MPRQVMNCAPNRLTTDGRHAAAGRFAAERGHAERVGQEEAGRLPHLGDQRVQVVGGGSAAQRLDRLLGGHLCEQSVLRVVDQLGLLAFLDGLDGQSQLLGDLVVRARVQVGDPGVHVEQRRDRAQRVLARAGLVVDVGLGQRVLGPGAALVGVDGHLLGVDHPVDAVDAGLDRHPAEQVQ